MRIIAIANQKGGCGKTTTAINLSSSLALKGQRVLLIDFDPQAHATMGLNVIPSDVEKCIYDVITPSQGGEVLLDEILIPIKDNFDLAPSNITLSLVEQELAGLKGREDRLHDAIKGLIAEYDYVIIDCPPSIGHLCFNALRAADEVVIPIDMSLFSLRGVAKLTEIILMLNEKLDSEIRSRALITMFDARTRYSETVLEKVKAEFGKHLFETVIRYNIRLRESVDFGQPVGDYDRHAIGHIDYENLANELIRSDAADACQGVKSAGSAYDILQKTEDFIGTGYRRSTDEYGYAEKDNTAYYSPESSYSEMIEAIATSNSGYSFSDPDDNY
ncbi:MAG: ParA family protein [Desulfatiglans sp.]|nr:ParA family protein [Desulfatiglans sp.]